jgi:hypothetical protein
VRQIIIGSALARNDQRGCVAAVHMKGLKHMARRKPKIIAINPITIAVIIILIAIPVMPAAVVLPMKHISLKHFNLQAV